MIFEELHTYLETTRSELSRDMLTVDKSSLSGEWMKREERFALFSFFENLIEMSRYILTSVDWLNWAVKLENEFISGTLLNAEARASGYKASYSMENS